MKTLNLATEFDQINTFTVNVGKAYPAKCLLKCGYDKRNDGIFWGLKKGAMLKDVYTAADYAETERLANEAPLENGELVLINGEIYKTRVLGDYSNAVIFDRAA